MNTPIRRVMIAIITFNGDYYIEKCINSIKSTKHEITIEIVDNASTDGTKDILDKFKSKINTRFLNENIGFGQANNILLKQAIKENYDYIYLLNQDAYYIENSLDNLIDYTYKYCDNCIVSPFHLKNTTGIIEKGFKYRLDQSKKDSIDSLVKTDFVNAAAWLMPIKLVKLVGGFSPLFFHYGEDNDYANRLKWFGFNFIICPTSFIVHDREYKRIKDSLRNDDKTYKKKVQVHLLTQLSNINSCIFGVLISSSITLLGVVKKTLVIGKVQLALFLLFDYIAMIILVNQIMQHRLTARKKGAFL